MATTTDTQDQKAVKKEFDELVNMTATQLKKWLGTDESKSVGQKQNGDSESTGHKSGERIVSLLGKKTAEYSDDDYAHMRKVISYIKRHSAQEPKESRESNWEYSLKNWGHDPNKR